MPIFRWSELERCAFDPQHSAGTGRQYAGQKIEVARVRYPEHTEVRTHAIPHEQVHAILEGRARYRVGSEERVVGPQDVILIRPGTQYEAHFLEPVEAVVFRDRLATRPGESEASVAGVFFNWDALQGDFITPRYSSAHGPTLTGGRIEVSRMLLPTATEGKPHRHPNEQIQVVLSGKARAMIDGEEHLVDAQGGVLFPSDVEHGAKVIEDYRVLNCKDVVPGWSVYHARWEK